MPPEYRPVEPPSAAALTEYAPAKINLYLHVVGRRDDGYHLLDSLVVFARAGDQLTVTPASDLLLSVIGPFAAGLQHEDDNLVLKAARALAAEAGVPPAARLVLQKNLPVASGIGGGSADAAATLRLLCRFWRLQPDPGVLQRIARSLGADVPVCLGSRPALMSGIGETLAPAPSLPDVGMVLVNPGVGISTPSVFRARIGEFSAPADFPAPADFHGGDLALALRATRNDLEQPACGLAPVIGDVLGALAAVPGCRLARMSGSGATCFGLFDTPAAAEAAAEALKRDQWWVWGGSLAHQ
jgi:4-diphosphocytidyl-2-C-methyl-D-erythritol kinase